MQIECKQNVMLQLCKCCILGAKQVELSNPQGLFSLSSSCCSIKGGNRLPLDASLAECSPSLHPQAHCNAGLKLKVDLTPMLIWWEPDCRYESAREFYLLLPVQLECHTRVWPAPTALTHMMTLALRQLVDSSRARGPVQHDTTAAYSTAEPAV